MFPIRFAETMLVDLLKAKSTNIPPFTSYINERLEGLDPHHRRVAERRLMQVLDQVEQEQEQSRAPSYHPIFNPQQQSWQSQGPPCHVPSWSQQLQSDWQGWHPRPNQCQPPTGSQPTVWGSHNAAWVQSQYPMQCTSAAAGVTTTTTSTPARRSSSTSIPAAPLTNDDGTTFTVLSIPDGNTMDESLTLLGNESFNTLLGGLSTPDKAVTPKTPDDKQDQ